MTSFEPTREQAQACHLFDQELSFKIEACAGSGKTTTLKLLASRAPHRKGLYLAFNKAIQLEAAASFPDHVECRTAHSMAYRAVVTPPLRERLGRRLTPGALAGALGLDDWIEGELSAEGVCGRVLGAMSRFCASDARAPGLEHVRGLEGLEARHAAILEDILPTLLTRTWASLRDPSSPLPITHDVYLKIWALSRPRLPHDFVLFDEAQDASPVLLGLVEHWRALGTQVVFVGDRYQQIYAWRGAINAMERVELEHTTALTRSFRYGDAIAALANRVLIHHRQVPSAIQGDPGRQGTVLVDSPCEAPDAILCRTNAGLISALAHQLDAGRSVHVAGGVRGLIALLEGVEDLRRGRRPRAAELAAFSSWDELCAHAETESGQDLVSLIRLVEAHELSELLDLLERARDVTPGEADVVVSTIHKSKGLEWDRVRLAPDFPLPEGAHERLAAEDAHLLYVAITRARELIDISACPAAHLAPTLTTQARRSRPSTPGDAADLTPAQASPTLEFDEETRARLLTLANQQGLTPAAFLRQLLDAHETRQRRSRRRARQLKLI